MIAEYIIKKHVRESDNVLDLGCGRGLWNNNHKNHITGVDISLRYLSHYDESIQHDLDKGLPELNRTYDLVIAKDVLEHLIKPVGLLIETNVSAMKEGGTLIVKVPDYRSKNAWADYTHIRPYTKGAIMTMLKDAGFKVKKVYRLGGYFLPSIFPQAFSWLVVAEKER